MKKAKTSAAYTLLSHVWESGMKDSWRRINNSMSKTLSLAIGAGLEFHASDFKRFASEFNWGYWVSDSTEWIYTKAIVTGNISCVEAYESWKGRLPFRVNNCSAQYTDGYIHANWVQRKRERIGVGMSFRYEGTNAHVTSFDDTSGIIRCAIYKGPHQDGKPKRRLTFTHEQMAEMFPSKEKMEKQSRALLKEVQVKLIEIERFR